MTSFEPDHANAPGEEPNVATSGDGADAWHYSTPSAPSARRRPTKILAAIGVAVVAVVALVAVQLSGGSGLTPTGAAAAAVRSAAATTLNAQGAKVSFTASAAIGLAGRTVTESFVGSGEFGFRDGVATMSMSLPSEPQLGTIREIMVNGNVYESGPAVSALLTNGDHWVEISGLNQNAYKSTSSNPTLNSSAYLTALEGQGGVVAKAGTATVGGQATTKYDVTLSRSAIESALKNTTLSPSEVSTLQTFYKTLNTMHMSVWVATATNRIVQMSINGFHLQAEGVSMTMNMTMRFTSYVAKFSVTVPSPSQVTKINSNGTVGSAD